MTLHNRDFQQRSEIFVLVKHFKRLSPRAQNGDRFQSHFSSRSTKTTQWLINNTTPRQHNTTPPPSSKPLSILHLAVAATSAVRSNSFLDDESISLFPSAQVFLLSLNSSPTPLILKSTVKDDRYSGGRVPVALRLLHLVPQQRGQDPAPHGRPQGEQDRHHHQDDDDRDDCRWGEVMHDGEMGGSGESDVMAPRPSDLVACASDGLS